MCCGNKRVEYQAQRTSSGHGGAAVSSPPIPAAPSVIKVIFEYFGQAPLNVIAPVSGRRYHFEGRGSRITVDPRDRRALAEVPRLRLVS
jgi:hypothetical protein